MKTLTLKRGALLVCALTLLSAVLLACAAPGVRAASKRCADNSCKPLDLSGGGHISTGSAGGSIARTVIGLAIVLAVIYGLYWVMKQTKKPRRNADADGLEPLASLPLGSGRSLALVRVGAEIHLLGIAEHGISPIRVYTEEEAYELGLPVEASDGAGHGWDAGLPPVQRVIDSMKRRTFR